MRIQSIGSYYSSPLNNTKKVEKKGGNIRFGFEINKYDAAYAVSIRMGNVEELERELAYWQRKAKNSFFFTYEKKIDRIKSELSDERQALNDCNKEYQSFKPSSGDFLSDVEKGRAQNEERQRKKELEKRYSSYSSGEPSSYPDYLSMTQEYTSFGP